MFDFTGQKVLITGGTRGIGRGITEAFLKANATVIATYLKDEFAAQSLISESSSIGGKLIVKKCDVREEKQIVDLFAMIEQEIGSLQIVVNNSGIREDQLTALMTFEQWQRVLNTNLNGTFFTIKQAILHFMPQKYGRIINITSMGGHICFPGQGNYAASKAAQEALSKSAAKEVGRKNITINNVAPGFIDTELLKDLSPEQVKSYQKLVPMNRFGKVSEVAHGVLFLATKEASYISGTTLDIGGGL